MTIHVETVVKSLASKRPVFHSEADFQHALAWEIQQRHHSAALRLEVNKGIGNHREHLDILVHESGETLALELKYKTKKLDTKFNDEEFRLQDQGAQDTGRYDFIKDINRLERFVASYPNSVGCAALLTNDQSYWNEARSLTTTDAMFRIHENRTLQGDFRWSEATGPGTMKTRENPLTLRGSHTIKWVDYSKLDGSGPVRLRYVLLEVSRQ
jgi:hypothetical protein